MKKIFLIACILFAPAAIAADGGCGENCVPKPDCESLGYKPKGDITCVDGYVTCPFDREYIWCRQYSCSDGGFSATNTPTVNGKMCAPVSFHGLNCFDCNQDKICKWTDYNKGDYATLSGPCEKGTFTTCETDYLKMWQENPATLLKLPDNAKALDTLNYTSCGQTIPLYTKWECDKGYEQKTFSMSSPYGFGNEFPITTSAAFTGNNSFTIYQCKPISPSNGFSQISNCDGQVHPEGFTFEVDPNDPDPANPTFGRCIPKSCPSGTDTQSALGCDDDDFLAIDAFSGNDPCGSCRSEDSISCVEPYVDDGNGHCSCSKEHYALVDGQCQCNPAQGWTSDGDNGCECNTSNGYKSSGDSCVCDKYRGYYEGNGQCVGKTCKQIVSYYRHFTTAELQVPAIATAYTATDVYGTDGRCYDEIPCNQQDLSKFYKIQTLCDDGVCTSTLGYELPDGTIIYSMYHGNYCTQKDCDTAHNYYGTSSEACLAYGLDAQCYKNEGISYSTKTLNGCYYVDPNSKYCGTPWYSSGGAACAHDFEDDEEGYDYWDVNASLGKCQANSLHRIYDVTITDGCYYVTDDFECESGYTKSNGECVKKTCETGYVLNENGVCDCDTENGYEILSDGTCKKKKTQVVVLKNTLTGSSNGISENGTCSQSQASSTNMSGYLCQPKQTIRFYDCAYTGSSSCTLIATYNEEKDTITGNTYTLSYYGTLALSVENTLSRCNYGIVYTGGMGNQYGYKCFRQGSEYSTFSNSGGTTIFAASQNKVYLNSTPSGGSPWFPQGVYHGSVGSATTTPSTPVDVNITFSFSGCSPSSYSFGCGSGSYSSSDITSSNTLVVKKGGTQVSATSGTTYKLTTGTTYTVGFTRPYCYRNGTSYSAHHVASSGSAVANLTQPNNDTNTWKQFTFQPNGSDATVTITCNNWTSGY